MAKLTSKTRNSLPADEFGLPGRRAYPMPDANHARAALSRASQMLAEGRLSASEKARIDAMAHRKLAEG